MSAVLEKPRGIVQGPDLTVAKNTVIRPGIKLVEFTVPDAVSMAPLRGLRPKINLRSRYAQQGLNTHHEVVSGIVRASSDEKPVLVLPIQNLSRRPISVDAGKGLLKPYGIAGEHLEGDELENVVDRGAVRFSGEQGVAWDFWQETPTAPVSGIIMHLAADKHTWLPPHHTDEPVHIDPDNGDALAFRNLLAEHMEEVTNHAEMPQQFVNIGETEGRLGIDPPYDALITEKFKVKGNTTQLHSRILRNGPYGEQSEWPIRTEHIVTDGTAPTEIVLAIYKSDD